MGQYKHNFYGTSYYGATNAYSGLYETNYIDTDEILNKTVDVKIKARLPKAFYPVTSEEFVVETTENAIVRKSGTAYGKTFDYHIITNPATSFKLSATADSFVLHYLNSPESNASIKVEIRKWTTELAYTTTNHTITVDKTKTGAAAWTAPITDYATYEVIISLPAGSTLPFFFGGCEVGATNLTIETRASLNEANWTTYQKLTYTKTLIEGDWYYLQGVSPNYAGKNRIQLKVFMASSDNMLSPEIENILTTAGDTKNRTEDGTWIAEMDMAAIATAAGKTFKKVLRVDWTDRTPEGTTIRYRTRVADKKDQWNKYPISVPYVKGTSRLRLKEGKNYGYITTGILDPASRNPNLQNLFWLNWSDKAHLPEDRVETGYYYELLDEKNAVIFTIKDPSTESYKLLEKAIKGRPFKLRIQLFKRYDKSTPAVDSLNFQAKLHFTEDKVINNRDVSAVDAKGTGEKVSLEMSTLTFNFPPEIDRHSVEYRLIDEIVRPEGVGTDNLYLYYASEKNASSRSDVTTNPNDKVWVKCIGKEAHQGIGNVRHYQYGGGISYFETAKSDLKKYLLTSVFTPSLQSGKKYRNFIQPGWPTQYHVARQGETLHTIAILYSITEADILAIESNAYLKEPASFYEDGTIIERQVIEIPNNTVNPNTKVYWESEKDVAEAARTSLSEKLVHNNQTNDSVMAEVLEAFAKGEVDWVSEEKIYDGFLNLNHVAKAYQREHIIPNEAKDQEHEHPVKTGETYLSIAALYGIDEEDLRWKNGAKEAVGTDTPRVGSILIVPSKVVLPSISPDIRTGANPYEIQIIHNSVKMGNELMPKDLIDTVQMEVIYEEATVVRQAVKRGAAANTSDFLPHHKVVRVTGIYNSLVEDVGAPYFLTGVDYNVVGNAIDWSLKNAVGKEPVPGNTYYVSYVYLKPVGVKIKIDSSHQVQIGSDRLWRSSEIKDFAGTVTPDQDFIQELPPIESWKDYNTKDVYDIDYVIEDNDVWVKTWIEERDGKAYLIGSLMGKEPKNNWIPYIHTGFYYLGKEEHYLFSEPITHTLKENDIPIAKHVAYAPGKHENAILVQPASKNLIRNSGFDVATTKTVIRKITF